MDERKERSLVIRKKYLYETVIKALELHSSYEIPRLKLPRAKRRLVVGSGNALPTARIIFRDEDAIFAVEGQYRDALKRTPTIKSAVVISASGEKDAPGITRDLKRRVKSVFLLTCNQNSRAARLLPADHVVVTKKLKRGDEPYTYNTSTYMGMMLLNSREDPERILTHLEDAITPHIPNLSGYNAFYLILDPQFDPLREMFVTKFDELFGPMLRGRCYTLTQTHHAKTLVPSPRELFISFGYPNQTFGYPDARWNVPLFEGASYAAMMAIGYYVIGHIQAQFSPWFFNNVNHYKTLQKRRFKRRAK